MLNPKTVCAVLNTLVRWHTLAAMLPPEEIAQIKAEIERLEKLREDCTNSGIRERIVAWIEAEKKKLESPGGNYTH